MYAFCVSLLAIWDLQKGLFYILLLINWATCMSFVRIKFITNLYTRICVHVCLSFFSQCWKPLLGRSIYPQIVSLGESICQHFRLHPLQPCVYITTRIIFPIFKCNHAIPSLKLSMAFQNFLNEMQAIEDFPCSTLFTCAGFFLIRCPHSRFITVTPNCMLFPEYALLIHTTELLHMLSSTWHSLPQPLSSYLLLVPTQHSNDSQTTSLPGAYTTSALATTTCCLAGSPLLAPALTRKSL